MAEKEKRRATTFRTSRGAIVNVAAPQVYVSPSITRNDVLEALDVHSTFQWERFLEDGLKRHFIGREKLLDGTEQNSDPSSFWKQVDYGVLGTYDGTYTLPKNRMSMSAYSRRAFDYPHLVVRTKLPNLVRVGNETNISYYFGLEHGSAAYNGIASFMLYTSATVSNRLYCVVGVIGSSRITNIDVNKPVDFLAAYHVYRVLHSRNLTMLTIDHTPALFLVPAVSGALVVVKENVLPYSIILTPPLPKSLTAFVEMLANLRSLEAASDVVSTISPYQFRVSDGYETLSLRLPLYEEDTSNLFAGKSVAAGALTSHPFPIFGYANKTICFRANQAGTLLLRVRLATGNWDTYDTLPVAANTLLPYVMTGSGVLARLTFTPSAYPCTVSEGEVVLG